MIVNHQQPLGHNAEYILY